MYVHFAYIGSQGNEISFVANEVHQLKFVGDAANG